MAKRCYINSLAQISCQLPLTDEWFTAPRMVDEPYVRSQEADIKGLIAPAEARRMSKVLKRAICTSLTALKRADVDMPDAIITGTGKGCIENSEKFLTDMAKFGESCLKPTLFMQSTHNTISSQIAIVLKCHGYNNTYSHNGISFESALFDAVLQLQSGAIDTSLVGCHDEVTPMMAELLRQTEPTYTFISEASVSAVVSTVLRPNTLCEVTDVKILNRPELTQLAKLLEPKRDSSLLLGVNGNELNDKPYEELLSMLNFAPATLQYKNIFGNNASASALSLCVGATLLGKQSIPPTLCYGNFADASLENITILNHSDGATWSLIRLKRI